MGTLEFAIVFSGLAPRSPREPLHERALLPKEDVRYPPPTPNSAVYCSVVLCCWANSLTSPSCSLIHHTVGSNHHLPGLSSFSPCKLLCIQHLLSRCVTVLHCVPHVSLTGCALGGELGTPALAAVDTRTWEEKPACGGRRSPSMP